MGYRRSVSVVMRVMSGTEWCAKARVGETHLNEGMCKKSDCQTGPKARTRVSESPAIRVEMRWLDVKLIEHIFPDLTQSTHDITNNDALCTPAAKSLVVTGESAGNPNPNELFGRVTPILIIILLPSVATLTKLLVEVIELSPN